MKTELPDEIVVVAEAVARYADCEDVDLDVALRRLSMKRFEIPEAEAYTLRTRLLVADPTVADPSLLEDLADLFERLITAPSEEEVASQLSLFDSKESS